MLTIFSQGHTAGNGQARIWDPTVSLLKPCLLTIPAVTENI